MTSYLVAYYSWTGNTAKVANLIAEELSADIEHIQDIKPRRGVFVFAATAFASVLQKSSPIVASIRDVADYDILILGSPTWGANMATPMRTYIMREKARIKQVGLFCTLGGSGGKAVLTRMAALCERTPLAELMVGQSAFGSGAWRGLTGNFAQQIRKSNAETATVDAA